MRKRPFGAANKLSRYKRVVQKVAMLVVPERRPEKLVGITVALLTATTMSMLMVPEESNFTGFPTPPSIQIVACSGF